MKHIGLYQAQHKSVDYKPTIYLFYRNKDRTKTVKKITDFEPYFYIKEDILLQNKRHDRILRFEPVNFPSIFGDKVLKCYVKKHSDIYYIREFYKTLDNKNPFKNLFEADILFDLRYMIDEVEDNEATDYRIITLDIETDCLEGFPKKENPVEPIICLSLKDNYTNKNVAFAWRGDLEPHTKGDIHYYKKEEDMLNAFLDYWHSLDADIVTGWNLGFDMGYLLARLSELKMDYRRLSNVHDNIFNGEVQIMPKGEIEILGKVLFDGLRAYKKMHFGELSSYSLNSVAHDELGEEKDKVYNTGEVWREDIDKLINYNVKDVELTWRIIEKAKLINIFEDIKNFSGVRNINDCFFASRIHETRIMKKYKRIYAFPTKKPFQEKSDETRIQGGFVKDPIVGMHENVIVLDFKSLYPSLIYTFNLSTEMVKPDGVNLGNGVKIQLSPKGIMANMIKDLVQLKDNMKKKVEGTGQNISDKMFAIKTFINSFYGVNALTSFRLYNKDIAESITYLGRTFVNELSEYIEKELGFEVVYNDTDSMFVKVNQLEDGDIIRNKVNKKVQDLLDKKYGLKDSNMTVEFEKMYRRIILQTKKRYAGLVSWEDGKIKDDVKIAGMAARRSDTSSLSKKVQRDLLKSLLHGGSKEDAVEYVKKVIDDIINGKITNEDLAIPTKLNNNTEDYKVQNIPKVRGVNWSNKNLKTQFSAGQKFLLIYVKHPETDVICFEEEEQIKDFRIDKELMIDKVIILKIQEIFNALSWQNELSMLEFYIKNKLSGQKTL